MSLIFDCLKSGDKVAVIAPAGRIAEGSLLPMQQCMERWGLQPILGEHVYARHHTFAGTDEQRRFDLQWAVNDPDIKAIICARGGYGTTRIIDSIDYTPLLQQPKILVGFSDITALHARWNHLGLQSVHAIMASHFPPDGSDDESTESLRKALFGETLSYNLPYQTLNKTGQAEGVLVGGNITMIAHLTGSVDEWDTHGKILFLEDLNEPLYALDRMLLHLQRSGKFEHIKGLVLGYFTDMKDGSTSFGKTVQEIISSYIENLPIPVAYGFPAGHEKPNLAFPFGRSMKLDVSTKHTTLEFAAPQTFKF